MKPCGPSGPSGSVATLPKTATNHLHSSPLISTLDNSSPRNLHQKQPKQPKQQWLNYAKRLKSLAPSRIRVMQKNSGKHISDGNRVLGIGPEKKAQAIVLQDMQVIQLVSHWANVPRGPLWLAACLPLHGFYLAFAKIS